MPAPISQKMRGWNDEIGSRSRRAPALTVAMESPRLRCPVNPSDGKLSHSAARDYSAPLQAQFRHHVAEPQVVARDELAEFLGGKERRGEADRLAGGRE